jgi:hypothetical protein
MKKKACNPYPIIWKVSFLFGLLFLALGLALPTLADYLGPNRTVTTWTWERLHCEYFAMYDPPGPGYYGCYLHLYDTPSGSCPPTSSTPPYFNPTACVGWPGTCGADFSCSINLSSSIEGCSQGEQGCTSTAHTVTYPPATVSGSVACTLTGNDGWCTGAASLSVSASEPVGGYSITVIEGSHNGSGFSCPGASCEVALSEGQNDFTFWAHSTFGDTSSMGSASGKVDSQPPQVSLSGASSFCPGCGESLNVSLTVSDATSGVSSWTLSLDGTTLTGGSAPTSQTYTVPSAGLSAGSHSLTLSASDVAGNTNGTSLTFTLLLPTPTPTFTPTPTRTFTSTPTRTFTPLPTSTPLPPPTATHAQSGGGASQGNEPASQSGSSQSKATPTQESLVTPSPTSLGQAVIQEGETTGSDSETSNDIDEPSIDVFPVDGAGGGGLPVGLGSLAAAAAGLGAAYLYMQGQSKNGAKLSANETQTSNITDPGSWRDSLPPLDESIDLISVKYP